MLGERLFSTLIPALALICFKNRQCCFPRARPALLAQSCLCCLCQCTRAPGTAPSLHPGTAAVMGCTDPARASVPPVLLVLGEETQPWGCALQTRAQHEFCCGFPGFWPGLGAAVPEPGISQCLGPPEGSGSSLVCHSILFRVRAWP